MRPGSSLLALAVVLGCSGGPATEPRTNQPPTELPKIVARSISVGSHNCSIRDDGESVCWGTSNERGELGTLGTPRAADTRNISGGVKFADIQAGYIHTCAVTAAGVGYCWGMNRESINTRGMIGDGTDEHRFAPTAVVGGLTFKTIVPGGHHSCGITLTNETWCWGKQSEGELGTGDIQTGAQLSPVRITSGPAFVSLTLGYKHSCGLTQAGKAYCWGPNAGGRLGNGIDNNTISGTPQEVSGNLTFLSLSAGDFGNHTCGVAADSSAYCWGQKSQTSPLEVVPTPVPGGMKFGTVATGARHACGLSADGKAYCWGVNMSGQIGDGSFTDRPSPVAVLGGIVFQAISSGVEHTCGLGADGAVYCWGRGGGVDATAPVKAPGF